MRYLALLFLLPALVMSGSASLAENNDGCTPGKARCKRRPQGSSIEMCDALGNWRLAADCGGELCCRVAPDDLPHCNC